jgi:hypothetical protein
VADDSKVQGDPPLSATLQTIVNQASSIVWRIERRFVRKRLIQQLPRLDGKRYDDVAKRGVASIALDLAGVLWAIAGGWIALLVVVPEEIIITSGHAPLKFGSWAVVAALFSIAFFRMWLARRSSAKFQSSQPSRQ